MTKNSVCGSSWEIAIAILHNNMTQALKRCFQKIFIIEEQELFQRLQILHFWITRVLHHLKIVKFEN